MRATTEVPSIFLAVLFLADGAPLQPQKECHSRFAIFYSEYVLHSPSHGRVHHNGCTFSFTQRLVFGREIEYFIKQPPSEGKKQWLVHNSTVTRAKMPNDFS